MRNVVKVKFDGVEKMSVKACRKCGRVIAGGLFVETDDVVILESVKNCPWCKDLERRQI